ncbi:MAG: hypothetical protein A2W31_14765 [Planctomycetes bacterium RBG_16_64_10]|nr:MAG: hypothetical protein A2W31_14765 [Planctomycetes bacterium RBG_16_64_10]
MTRALVTGASGFIGWHLAAALSRRGDQVRCLVRRTSRVDRLEALGVELVTADVRVGHDLQSAVREVDVVYHLAGLTRGLSLDELLAVNEAGVENVARACARQARVPVLVVISSLAAAGPSPVDCPRTKREPPAPVSNYGRSKLAGERAAARWAREVPTTIVRPPIVFGQGDRDGFLMFRMIARRGVHLVPAMGMARVSVIHAEDLATALLLVADRGARLAGGPANPTAADRGIYFVADPDHLTYVDLGRLIGHAVGRPDVRVLHVPQPLVQLAALATEAVVQLRRKPSLLGLDKFRDAIAGSWTCDCQRIRSTLGFAPAYPLAQRLQETADWYRREGWLPAPQSP